MKIFPLLCLALLAPAFAGCGNTRTPTVARTATVFLSPAAATQMAAWVGHRPDRRAGDIAATGSMRPALDEEHIVIVERRAFRGLKGGDIVLISSPRTESTMAHRLVERLPTGWWVTRGDANDGCDPLMSESDYGGAVVIAAIQKRTGVVRRFDEGAVPGAVAEAAPLRVSVHRLFRVVCEAER